MDKQEIRVGFELFSIGVSIEDEVLARRLTAFYREFLTELTPCLIIQAKVFPGNSEVPTLPKVTPERILFEAEGYQGSIDWRAKEADLIMRVSNPLIGVDYFLRVAAAVSAFYHGGMLIHAAGVERDGKGYLFIGYSGAGKTTTARNSPLGSVLNDDLLVVYPKEGVWVAAATPFYNPTQNRPRPGSAPITKLSFLVKDQKVYLEKVPQAQALAEMVACVPVLTVEPFYLREILERSRQLLNAIPYYHLHLLPDDSYWRVLLEE